MHHVQASEAHLNTVRIPHIWLICRQCTDENIGICHIEIIWKLALTVLWEMSKFHLRLFCQEKKKQQLHK